MPKLATPHRVAVVQHPPVTLHRRQTLERGVRLIEEAATKGARLISFPETWVPGYPEWLWRLRPGGDYELTGYGPKHAYSAIVRIYFGSHPTKSLLAQAQRALTHLQLPAPR